MSRRERSGRDSDSRRHRSGFDRESSPKRSRRDGKPDTERVLSTTGLNTEDRKDRDQTHQCTLQDALPLEVPVPDSKVESGVISKDLDKKPNGRDEGNDRASDPADVPRSRSYFQHDERGNAAQVGRSFGRRATTDRRQRDSKDDHHDSQQRDERPVAKRDNIDIWRHDGFIKMESEPVPATRKRRAFRETKIPLDTENVEKVAPEPVKPSHSYRPLSFSERRGERDHNPTYSNRYGKPVTGERKEAQRGSPWERYGGAGEQWGRERLSGRQGYQPGGNRADKWKHDLFDEANRSPTKKTEEDQIAKVEALLSS